MASQQKNEAMIAIAKEMHNVPWCKDYEKMISGMLLVPSLSLSQRLCADDV
jgi:hypothetical protein